MFGQGLTSTSLVDRKNGEENQVPEDSKPNSSLQNFLKVMYLSKKIVPLVSIVRWDGFGETTNNVLVHGFAPANKVFVQLTNDSDLLRNTETEIILTNINFFCSKLDYLREIAPVISDNSTSGGN